MKIAFFLLFLLTILNAEESIQKDAVKSLSSLYPNSYFIEKFNTLSKDWIVSSDPKFTGIWKVAPDPKGDHLDDSSLILSSPAHHSAIVNIFHKPISFMNKKSFVVQYEVRFNQFHSCGGAYMKLISVSDSENFSLFNNETPYSIMFGPDRCGTTDKIHFIFRYANPKSGKVEEKHFKNAVDNEVKGSGDLFTDFNPSVIPPSQIPDPNDILPNDWDNNELIPDKDAIPPPETPSTIIDTEAKQPEDWNEEEDGVWEPPTIPNPNYKGKWSPPMIKNPNFKGKWKAREIDNPDYFEVDNVFHTLTPIAGIGFELWSMQENITFDNIFIGSSDEEAIDFAEKYFHPKQKIEKAAEEAKKPKDTSNLTGIAFLDLILGYIMAHPYAFVISGVFSIAMMFAYCILSRRICAPEEKEEDEKKDESHEKKE